MMADADIAARLGEGRHLTALDRQIIERRMGPLRERLYREADRDDFEVARLRVAAGGIVHALTGGRLGGAR